MTDPTVEMLMNTHTALFEGGRKYERELIVEELEAEKAKMEKQNKDQWASPNMAIRIKAFEFAIALIKGETE